jgi:hypothetical protein
LALYSDYQASVARVRVILREIVRMVSTPQEERAQLARAAFVTSGFYEVHYRLSLLASLPVHQRASLVMEKLHAIRNSIEGGALWPDPGYDQCVAEFESSRDVLHQTMRKEFDRQ